MLLEICVDNLNSVLNAITAGASRLELCSALTTGGLTPTVGFLKAVQSINTRKIPIFCMIRCRESDFIYTEEEFASMITDMELLKNSGADGFVFGALTDNNTIDVDKCLKFRKKTAPLPITFHRAFDVCTNPFEQAEILISLGYNRILTNGCAKNVQLGCTFLAELVKRVDDRIIIIVGGGLTDKNFEEIIKKTNAKEFHASAKKPTQKSISNQSFSISQNDSSPLMIADPKIIENMLNILIF